MITSRVSDVTESPSMMARLTHSTHLRQWCAGQVFTAHVVQGAQRVHQGELRAIGTHPVAPVRQLPMGPGAQPWDRAYGPRMPKPGRRTVVSQ